MTSPQTRLQHICIETHAKDPRVLERSSGLIVDVSRWQLANGLGHALVTAGLLSHEEYDPEATSLVWVGLVTRAQVAVIVLDATGVEWEPLSPAPPSDRFHVLSAGDHGICEMWPMLSAFMQDDLDAKDPDDEDDEDDEDEDEWVDGDGPGEEALALADQAVDELRELYLTEIQKDSDAADTHVCLVVDCGQVHLAEAMDRASFEPLSHEELASGADVVIEFVHEDDVADLLAELKIDSLDFEEMLSRSPGNIRIIVASAEGVNCFNMSLKEILHPSSESAERPS